MRSLLGRVILVISFFLSSLYSISCHSFPSGLHFLLKDQLLALWGFPCMLFFALPLLPLIFVFNFCQFDYYVSWHIFLWVYPAWDCLGFLDLDGYFLSHVREFFYYNLFRYVLITFLVLFFSGTPVFRMLVHLMLSQRSLRLSSFLFILFSLFYSLICSSPSVILLLVPSNIFFISVIVLFIADCPEQKQVHRHRKKTLWNQEVKY